MSFKPSDPDQRKWTRADVIAGLNSLAIPECTLFIHRKDRHNPSSLIDAITLHVEGALDYDQVTQVAGLFDTPHISFAPRMKREGDCDGSTCADANATYIEIVIKWEATPPASKVVQ